MASAPQALPLFYNALEPLSSETHANFRFNAADAAPFLVNQHAIPVTVDEFVATQPWLPIVFTTGDDSIPIALMGLNEGVNVFVGDDGKLIVDKVYVPAYIRRYPFMLARLRPDAQDLSLCFDPTSETIGAFEQGEALFADGTGASGGGIAAALNAISSAAVSNKVVINGRTESTGLVASTGLYTAAKAKVSDAEDKVTTDAATYKERLTKQYAASDARVAAYKATQTQLQNQIDQWNKSS